MRPVQQTLALLGVLCFAGAASAQVPAAPAAQAPAASVAGRAQFDSRCAVCHGGDGNAHCRSELADTVEQRRPGAGLGRAELGLAGAGALMREPMRAQPRGGH